MHEVGTGTESLHVSAVSQLIIQSRINTFWKVQAANFYGLTKQDSLSILKEGEKMWLSRDLPSQPRLDSLTHWLCWPWTPSRRLVQIEAGGKHDHNLHECRYITYYRFESFLLARLNFLPQGALMDPTCKLTIITYVYSLFKALITNSVPSICKNSKKSCVGHGEARTLDLGVS